MADAVPLLDELIKEYLLFRGFTATLKTFENEIKADKDKSFRVSVFLVYCVVIFWGFVMMFLFNV